MAVEFVLRSKLAEVWGTPAALEVGERESLYAPVHAVSGWDHRRSRLPP